MTEDLYPVSHWRVAVDPGNLLVNELNAPLELQAINAVSITKKKLSLLGRKSFR